MDMPAPEPLRRNSTAGSDALFARALKVMPGGSTRAASFFDPHPPYAAGGAGARITDVDGNVYLDFSNNFFSQIHGHAHPEIVAAIIGQVKSGTSFPLPTETEVLLAEEICGRSPALEAIRFANSGTEGVMAAIKAARAFTGRPAIAKIEGAYHGSYDHVEISLDGAPANWGTAGAPARIAYARGTPDAVVADTVVVPFDDAEACRRILEANADRLAAVLLDVQPSRVGMIPASQAFVDTLRAVTRELGILLIVDEVVTYRLSHGGAHPLWNLTPDLVALGKVIGGGMPIGAVAGRRDVMSVFDSRGRKPDVAQGGTFTANPLTMIAGLTALRLLDRAAITRINALGDRLRAGIVAKAAACGVPVQVTGLGSFFRIHLTDAPITGYRSAFPSDETKRRVATLHRTLLDQGFLVTPNVSGTLSTPMTDSDIDSFVQAVGEILPTL